MSLSGLGWSGRTDAEDGEAGRRWHQIVQPWSPRSELGVVFVGFASDEGVRRNKGRIGAAEGPYALRKAMSNLPARTSVSMWDGGDIACRSTELETTQELFASHVAGIVQSGNTVIGLGGGHEIAWASFRGIAKSGIVRPGERLGILNLDTHFDLRKSQRATSGTSFRQILEASDLEFSVDYRALGISETANTTALFEAAERLGVKWRTDEELSPEFLETCLTELRGWFETVDRIYLSICLDVLPASVAPGVSAPAALGVQQLTIEAILGTVAASGKLCLADVAELCPRLDFDSHTARVAARLIARIVRGVAA